MSLLGPLALYSLTLGADIWSTDRALRNPYVTEGNPLMRERAVMVASHVATAAALTGVDVGLQRLHVSAKRNNRKRAAPLIKAGLWLFRGAVVVGGAYVTSRNLENARRAR